VSQGRISIKFLRKVYSCNYNNRTRSGRHHTRDEIGRNLVAVYIAAVTRGLTPFVSIELNAADANRREYAVGANGSRRVYGGEMPKVRAGTRDARWRPAVAFARDLD